MTAEPSTAKRTHCPSCGNTGKRVSRVTLGALLKDEFARSFKPDDRSCCTSDGEGCTAIQGDTGWRFCDSADCDVVYFSEDSDKIFTKSQLKKSVGVKETTGERPLCYCFGHSVATIKEELRTTGTSTALEDIRAKMKEVGCRCETENPSGSCCLGSVSRGIRIAQEELGMTDAGSDTEKPAPPSTPSGNKGGKIATIGTLVSAIMASACCWLPLVLLTVGVSGAGIAATLEEYRPCFMVITFGFLGAAFYYTYRPKRTAETGGGKDCCAAEPASAEDCCASSSSRFNMMAMNKVMLWGVTVMAVAFLLFPNYVGAFLGGDGKTVTDSMNRAVIKIDGMTCDGCSAIVAKAIRSVPGVLAVEVNYEKGEAVVGTEICCPVPTQQIVAALEKSGYKGTLVSSAGAAPVANEPPACCVPGQDETTSPATEGEAISRTVFAIEGMTCNDCETSVSRAVRSVPGITGVNVDYRSEKAVVYHHSCCPLPKEKVLTALKKAGFDGRIVEDDRQNSPNAETEPPQDSEK